MKSDEDSVTIAVRKLFLVVAHHSVGPPMGGKRGNRSNLARTNNHLFAAVATVFGRKDELLLHTVVIALGPAIVAASLQQQQLFGGQTGFFGSLINLGPIRMQLVSSVLGYK